MPKPNLAEVPAYYHNYVNKVPSDDLNTAFNDHLNTISFLQSIPNDKWDFRYAADKWSIKEMVQHIIDAERIFSYRALCFARNEKTSLPSFDENQYAAASKADKRLPKDLLEELQTVQKASQQLFASFDEEQLCSKGVANNQKVGVDALGFILIGHTLHHLNILKERYL